MKIISSRVIVPIAAISVCLTACPAEEHKNDFLIIPGERVGSITPQTSEADIERIFGKSNTQSKEINVVEEVREFGTVIYPTDETKMLEVLWKKTGERQQPEAVIIRGSKSLWKTPLGITLGTTMTELERLNGKPFAVSANEEFFGNLNSWEKGQLAKELSLDKVIIELASNFDKISKEEFDSLGLGERDHLMSNEKVMQKLNPSVSRFIVKFK